MKFNKKDFLIRTFITFCCFMIVYIMVSFYNADINFYNWSRLDRGMTMLSSLLISLALNVVITEH